MNLRTEPCRCPRAYGVRLTVDPDGVVRMRCQACGEVVTP